MLKILQRRPVYDRARLMEAAARARAKKKRHQAIELYRRVLAVERHNPDLHARLGPLLADTGQEYDAWISFQNAAQSAIREGLGDRALSIYREAASYLPREAQVWQAIARLEQKCGRDREAVEALLEGSTHFGSRWRWPEAIHLLRRARQIDPWDFETVFSLAKLLAKTDQSYEGGMLLEELARRSQGARLRRVRAAQFKSNPGPLSAWAWLREAVVREGAPPGGEDPTVRGRAPPPRPGLARARQRQRAALPSRQAVSARRSPGRKRGSSGFRVGSRRGLMGADMGSRGARERR